MSFDLASVLSQAAGRDTGIDSGRERIEYIPVQDIRDDANNFYNMDGIDELAANIEMIGLQQPIRVRKISNGFDFYRVISGHRRLAAWKKLDRSTPDETYRKIAAIVEPERDEPEALQKLRLIFANSDTRKMTGHDLQMQAREIKRLLQELKGSGFEFKGRMRDQVARICGVSKSKLSRLDAIENNLHEGIKNAFYSTGKIGETVAYEISRLPKADQSEACRKLVKGWEPTAEDVAKFAEKRSAEKAAGKELKEIRSQIRKDYDRLTEAAAAEEEPEKENVPGMGTMPEAAWQTGDPAADGRYLCLVDLNTTKLHEQTCERRDGEWLCYGSPIAEMFTVVAWWPLPPRAETMQAIKGV